MPFQTTLFISTLITSAVITLLVILLLHQFELSVPSRQRTLTYPAVDSVPPSAQSIRLPRWSPVGHTYDEQVRLRDMASVISKRPAHVRNTIPTVPCLSADSRLLVLSASASRIRYGTSVTFIMVYPTDVQEVLPKGHLAQPLFSNVSNLWCIFDDGSVTSAYSYDSYYWSERASLYDCPLSPFGSDELWKNNRTLRVYLASLADKDRNEPILKAFVSVPKPPIIPPNASQQLLTLCTSPLHNGADHLTAWVQFHLLVGFRRFAVYNTTDTHHRLGHVVDNINRQHPGLVDVVQWNFSALALKDAQETRYFQNEAVHDCLIRYGDLSEWLGMIDLDEYIVPLPPYNTVLQYLHQTYGQRIIGSITLLSQFFCTKMANNYTAEEGDTNRLTIERFILRAPSRHTMGREKYLYRPRFVHYLSIHHHIVGLGREVPSPQAIMLAHYATMKHLRDVPDCTAGKYINDTVVRDRFARGVKQAIQAMRR